jgi:hypothetical protein
MSLEYAMRLPSGDHAGLCSLLVAGRKSFVRLVWPVPFAPITQISPCPDRTLRNAIRVPSGDHTGWSSIPSAFVRRIMFVPSIDAT